MNSVSLSLRLGESGRGWIFIAGKIVGRKEI